MKKETMKQDEQSELKAEPKKARRELLGSGAMAAASMMFGLVAAACSDDDDSTSPTGDAGKSDAGGSTMRDGGGIDAATDTGVGNGDAGVGTDNDIAQLNALLNAEYLAITAYSAGADLISKAAASDPYKALAGPITQIAVGIQTQHTLHAQALVDAITSLRGIPVDKATVAATFKPDAGLVANPTIANVLKFAASKERDAAVAYNQVVAGLEAAKFRFLASVIEGDETQHFIVLAALVLGLAGPGPMLKPDAVFPAAFVHSFGSSVGLDQKPPTYWP